MQRIRRKWRRLGSVALIAGLIAGFYFYVLLRVRPELFYQQNSAVFLFDAGVPTARPLPPG